MNDEEKVIHMGNKDEIDVDKIAKEDNIILDEKGSSHSRNGNYESSYYVTDSANTNPKKRHSHGTGYNKHKPLTKKQIAKRIIVGILLFILIVVIGVGIAFAYYHQKGKKSLLAENEDVTIETVEDAVTDDSGQTVTYEGDTYVYNQNMVSIVFLGVDRSTLGTDEYGNAGQADAIYIFAYDTVTKKSSIIPVSRETMTDIDIYSSSGNYIGSETAQLCLAYAYGDGKKLSSQTTLKALSRLFYNIPLTYYVTVNWDVIEPINDAINGVTVKALETISSDGSYIVEGEKTHLLGHDAFVYVKFRDHLHSNTNANRLARQKQYIKAYINKLIPEAKKDIGIVSDLYGIADEYMHTNISGSQLVYIASSVLPSVYSAKDIPFKSIDGETKPGEEHDEFYIDNDSLYKTILDVYYTKQ